MTQARGVRYEADGAVGHIVLDRPEAANAMDLPAARALGDAVHAANDASIRAVLLTGEGKRFCAGGDVASFVAAPDRSTYLRELAGVLERNVRGLSTLTKPVVVAVQVPSPVRVLLSSPTPTSCSRREAPSSSWPTQALA